MPSRGAPVVLHRHHAKPIGLLPRVRARALDQAPSVLQLRMPAIDLPDDWQPTADAVNALPGPLRRYVINLETIADPASLVREATIQRETALALAERVRELEQPAMRSAGERAPVRQRHRAAAVRALMPATTEASWVWTEYVIKGDASNKQLRDVARAAQLAADAEAGLLLPPEQRAAEPNSAPGPVGMTTSAFMGREDK